MRLLQAIAAATQVAGEYVGGYGGVPRNFTGKDRQLLRQLKAACRVARRNPVMWCMVTDYAPGDPAEAKVKQALLAAWGRWCMFTETFVPAFDTLALSYDGLTQMCGPTHLVPPGLVGFLNVAPIYKDGHTNGHHPFYAVLLKNGHVLFSPNSDFSLSLIREQIVAVFRIPCAMRGEQFRSWQCFPAEAAKILAGDFRNIDAVWAADGDHGIPLPPESLCVRDDNFGNLKIRATSADLAAIGVTDGDLIDVLVDGVPVAKAIYGAPRGDVNGEHGEHVLTLRAGSGLVQMDAASPAIPFVDMFLIHGSASRICGNPTSTNVMSFRKHQASIATTA